MVEKKDYTVTDMAGPQVAGRRVNPGDTIALTEPEARFELVSGAIAPAAAADPFKAGSTPVQGPPAGGPAAGGAASGPVDRAG